MSIEKKKKQIEFVNFDSWQDFEILEYIIEEKLKIIPYEKNVGVFARYNRYRTENLLFELHQYDDMENTLDITVLDENPIAIGMDLLKSIAEKVLDYVRLIVKEYKINEYITMLFKGNVTYIVINGYIFRQCIGRYMFVPIKEAKQSEINSIEDASEKFDIKKHGVSKDDLLITPEDEFWAHCSNIQAWVENDYDTKIIHHNLAFSVLGRLNNLGDIKAKKVFKEEIAKRYNSSVPSVVKFLEEEGYLKYLSKEELEALKK